MSRSPCAISSMPPNQDIDSLSPISFRGWYEHAYLQSKPARSVPIPKVLEHSFSVMKHLACRPPVTTIRMQTLSPHAAASVERDRP